MANVDVTRAQTARRLALDLSKLSAVASALADEEVWMLTRDTRAQDVAEALGLTEAAVRKAIQQHNRRQSGLPPKRKVIRKD